MSMAEHSKEDIDPNEEKGEDALSDAPAPVIQAPGKRRFSR